MEDWIKDEDSNTWFNRKWIQRVDVYERSEEFEVTVTVDGDVFGIKKFNTEFEAIMFVNKRFLT